MKQSRIFNIMQYERNPVTGEDLHFNESNIKNGISYKSIKDYAYICHDSDVLTEEDAKRLNMQILEHATHAVKAAEEMFANDDEWKKAIEKQEKGAMKRFRKAGDLKNRHWHIVIRSDRAINVDSVAKWFGIAPQYIDCPKGAGAFLDCVEYLTHESDTQQDKGKHLYADSEVRANFDFRKELQERAERNAIRRGISSRDYLRYKVMYGGMTMQEVITNYPLEYQNDFAYLEKLRKRYIATQVPVPPLRINYYIDGPGGIGKNTAARALARALFPSIERDTDLFFEIGGANVSFDNYDGQPVIIWNDFRAYDIISRWGRGEAFDIFDSHPTSAEHNIKYGSVKLVNPINIVNGVETYQEFLNGLAGEYEAGGILHTAEDKGQAYRRFPIILCLRENDFDSLLNKGVAEGTREYEAYIGYRGLQGSFGMLAKRLEGAARDTVAINMLQPTLEQTEQVRSNESVKISDPSQIPDDMLNWGKPKSDEQLKSEYDSWLEDWFTGHESLRGTSNHPTYEWWLENVKR